MGQALAPGCENNVMTQSGDLAPLTKHLANLGGDLDPACLATSQSLATYSVPARHYFRLTYLQLFIHLRFPSYCYLLHGSSCSILSLRYSHTTYVVQLKSPNMAPSPAGTSSPDPATPRPDQSPSPSIRSQTPNIHAPTRPSQLREAHTLSPPPDQGANTPGDSNSNAQSSPSTTSTPEPTGSQTPNMADKDKESASSSPEARGQSSPPPSREPRHWLGRPPKLAGEARESTPLLRRPLDITSERAHEGPCNHGTFSPDTTSRPASIKSQETTESARDRGFFRIVAAGIAPANNVKRNTTARLAEEHGLRLNKTMYVSLVTSWRLFISNARVINGEFTNVPSIGT